MYLYDKQIDVMQQNDAFTASEIEKIRENFIRLFILDPEEDE